VRLQIISASRPPACVRKGQTGIGITVGAFAPEILVERVTGRLKKLGATEVAPLDGLQEKGSFPLPKGL
jgi:Penicillin tolerance protein